MTSISIVKSEAELVTPTVARVGGSVGKYSRNTTFIVAKSLEVDQVHRRLDHVSEAESGRVQDAADVVEHRAGLGLEAARGGPCPPGTLPT